MDIVDFLNVDNLKKRLRPNPSYDELYVFFMQLSTYYSAGEFGIVAFDSILQETGNDILRDAIKDIKKSITDGDPLSKAFSVHTFFPNFCIQAIAAGETSGMLDQSFIEIGEHLEQTGEVDRLISSAFLPVKIISALISIAITIMFSIVIPAFKKMYTEMKIELPFITRAVIGTISFFLDYWYIHLIVALVVVFVLKKFKREHREKWDGFILKMPLYSTVYYYILQYRFAKIYELLQKAGIGPVHALEITADGLDNEVYANILRKAAYLVKKEGIEVSKALKEADKYKRINFLLLGFITSGEKTGKSVELLNKASIYFSRMIKTTLKNFSEKIGPMFLSPMMFIIVLVILAVYYPIFSLTQGIK